MAVVCNCTLSLEFSYHVFFFILFTEYKEIFQLFDTDYDGIITTEEAAIVVRALGKAPTEQELHDIINSIDKGWYMK